MALAAYMDAKNALFEYAETLKKMEYPPEEICREIRNLAQQICANFAVIK